MQGPMSLAGVSSATRVGQSYFPPKRTRFAYSVRTASVARALLSNLSFWHDQVAGSIIIRLQSVTVSSSVSVCELCGLPQAAHHSP